jgi:type VI secretion-associated protein, VC_A0119 family
LYEPEALISELLDIITTPLAGQNPMGENINYDSDFDVLKAEMGKMGNIDYGLIENTCKKLLREKSKDIRVMCFLSYAVLRNEQWGDLADVFDGFVKLAEQNYDGMFPDRPRAKQMAIQWLAEPRYNECLEKKPEEKDYDHINRLLQALTKLKAVLEQKFPEGSPFPSGLYSAVTTWEKQCKPKPKAEGVTAGGTGSSQEPMETPKQAQTSGKKIARFLVEKEPDKIMGYRLMRSLRWDLLEKAPPAENGKTQLAPPPAELLSGLQNVLTAKDFKSALDKAEAAFAAGANHLCLGLQRISAIACKNLGGPYAALQRAIYFETGMLVKRVPVLLQLSFSNGSPMCDDATKEWIASEVRPQFSDSTPEGCMAAGGGAISGSIDRVEKEMKEAQALAASGSIEKALDLIQNALRCSSSERDNFRRSIMLCNLLVSAKQPDIALSILESLHEKINNYHLDKWDPDLSVEAWSSMVKVLKMAKANKPPNVQAAMHEKLNMVVSKISQIDPKKAFSLNT